MANRHWSGHVYYYLAALIGLGFIVTGLVMGSLGLIKAALPTASPEYTYRSEPDPERIERVDGEKKPREPTEAERREAKREARTELRQEGLYSALEGSAVVLVGAPVFAWHIRRARERERERDSESEET